MTATVRPSLTALESGTAVPPSRPRTTKDDGTQQPPPVAKETQNVIDPAAWGGNHVGKPVPEFVHGDECLFCHRNDVGVTWQKNTHGVTLRQAEDAPELLALLRKQSEWPTISKSVEYFLGSRHRVRFLKKEGYGKFALLNAQMEIGSDRQKVTWIGRESLLWDPQRFASQCAGCHTTGVDSATKTFAAFGLDCYACHGDVTLDHTNDTSLIWLSKRRRDDARAITSICAQCHLRLGKSRSTGMPYANNFIAGDNLFQDFAVDLSKADDAGLNPGDRHILRNVREVVLSGQTATTCLTCHQVHANTAQHHAVARGPICADCHGPGKLILGPPRAYVVHSALCEY